MYIFAKPLQGFIHITSIIMKPIIFNQRVTVFTNSFIGYSDTYKELLASLLGNIEEMGMLQPNFPMMAGPQQIISPNQIPPHAPWFIKVRGIRVELQPYKIDIVSDKFINTEEEEIARMNELVKLLIDINQTISIGSITRIAYAPSLGLESVDETSVGCYWKSIIGISDLADSRKREQMVRYNVPCKLDFGEYNNLEINRVVTITEGQRTKTKTSSDGKVANEVIECVIVSIDVNTNGTDGNYSIETVNAFCHKAQIMGRELLNVINCR